MFGQFAELGGVVLGVVVLGVVVLGDVVVPPPEAAQAAPTLAERATAATAATWRSRTIGYLLCRMLRSNQRHLSAVAENAVSVLRAPYLEHRLVRWTRVSEAERGRHARHRIRTPPLRRQLARRDLPRRRRDRCRHTPL